MTDTSGVLSGTKIKEELEAGRIRIEPLDPRNFNPASYDLTLGRKVAVYRSVTHGDWKPVRAGGVVGEAVYPHSCHIPQPPNGHLIPNGHLDARIANEVMDFELDEGQPVFLRPGIGYLMHTEERVWTDTYVPVLDGKSSIGRLFVKVHETAGYGDVGFDGQYTLEVTAMHPVILYPGMAICQIRFHTLVGTPELYAKRGHYTGEKARGPVPSQSHVQLKERTQ